MSRQYQHSRLSPAPPSSASDRDRRLSDALRQVRSMFDTIGEETRTMRQGSGTNDSKVRQYLRELEGVREQLTALETRHRMAKEKYETEIRQLKDEIDVVRQQQFREQRDRDQRQLQQQQQLQQVFPPPAPGSRIQRSPTPDRERDTRHWAQHGGLRPSSSAGGRTAPI
ncbi:hypothetical protein BKA62DRAFT_770725 [Auriculariales sp. MPI-PUGE-AT-0066]|nr:hypothetical protein BKA62DRAFT_770725 [Auriculariales sp. MPI-PUGE-AT-0066]